VTATCPHCHQRMLVRHGVQLPPLLADIFDLIEKRKNGQPAEVLRYVFWANKPVREGLRNVWINIYRLNDFLSSTDIRIERETRKGPYRLINGGGNGN